MKLDYALYECGLSTPPPDWLFYVNNQHHINRVYYIIEEGAGYIYKGEKYKFKKNYLYVLPHMVDLEYFLDDDKFLHLFMDFSSSTILNYNEVLSFPAHEYPLIVKNLDYLRFFLEHKINGFFNTFITSYDIQNVKERIVHIVSALFYDIMEEFPAPPLFDSSITKSLNFIQKNYHNPITRAEIARHVNLSESYFSKLFTEATGVSPYQYIKNYRFDIAISLISQGASINETAEKCGFSSVAAFSNSFKKKFGYSPSEYNK